MLGDYVGVIEGMERGGGILSSLFIVLGNVYGYMGVI